MDAIPRISVVMPVYNSAPYLREAVQSILDQTFADFELIAIDDGSTDESLAILREFARRDPRVKIISRPNTGIVRALNDGLAQARGELIARMDSDDVSLPHRLQRQVEYFDAHPDCVVVGSWIIVISEEGDELCVGENPPEHEQIDQVLLSTRGALCHPSVMMRASAVRQVGGYREEYRLAQDLDLFLRLGEIGRLANLVEPLLRYRLRPNSITGLKDQSEGQRVRLEMVRQACQRRGIPDVTPALEAPLPSNQIDADDDATLLNYYTRCCNLATDAGRLRVARKYALRMLGRRPFSKYVWWSLGASIVGLPVAQEFTGWYKNVLGRR